MEARVFPRLEWLSALILRLVHDCIKLATQGQDDPAAPDSVHLKVWSAMIAKRKPP